MNDVINKALKNIDELRNFVYGAVAVSSESIRTTHKYDLQVIEDNESGKPVLKLNQKPKALVISGGGGKGIAYAGMVTVMQEEGFLEQLTHISGASAGAMVASLMALGMDEADINAIVKELDIEKLVDTNPGEFRGSGDTFRNGLGIFYMFQMDNYLKKLEPLLSTGNPSQEVITKYNLLNTKLLSYRTALWKIQKEFNSVNDIIEYFQKASNFKEFNAQFNQELDDSSNHITFQDLATLREILPEEQKHLIKDLTVVVTNASQGKLEIKNLKNTPDASIANMVQISGAHPAIFQAVAHEGESKADGGIIDNMPIQSFLDEGMELKDIVCVCLTPDSSFNKKTEELNTFSPKPLSRFERAVDFALSGLIGGKVIEGDAKVLERQVAINFLNNLLMINTGDIGTLDLGASIEKKNIAIENAKIATKNFIENYKKPTGNLIIDLLATKQKDLIETIIKIAEPKNEDEIQASENLSTLLHACHTANLIKLLQTQFLTMQEGQVQTRPEAVNLLCQMKKTIDNYYKGEAEVAADVFQFCLRQINLLSNNKYHLNAKQFALITDQEVSTEEVNQITEEINSISYTLDEVLGLFSDVVIMVLFFALFEIALIAVEFALLIAAEILKPFEKNDTLELEPPAQTNISVQKLSFFNHGEQKALPGKIDIDNEETMEPEGYSIK